ncbi:hypothetical protein E3Q16_02603 [Wallemia mellicola]|uniref:Nucleoprotein TPR/MLP1 domain-containing protein n=1 Tax=Wallemia mellicola TaxID=1708541 RepID=A0AB38MW38_9BASI|nr:hypothetical protein E3Q16_02603 [Wallemia mellicola]TIC18218.1 hypothetical protein E3Q13_02047 [Wallemia mellicola]TIC66927.1 hypothetical protein E3Q02_01711 [Wallemia mellicola]
MVATRRAGRLSASAQEASTSEAPEAEMTEGGPSLELQRVREELEHYKVLLETEKASSLRHNINTEQSLSEQENKIHELEKELTDKASSYDGVVKERDLSREEAAKLKLQAKKTTTAEDPVTVSKIKELEELNKKSNEEKADLLKFTERLSADIDRLGTEVDTSRNRLSEAREENSKLTKEVHDAKSVETTSKYKIQSLEQENELLKKNEEWLNTELSKKSEEFSVYRREKHAELASAQGQIDVLETQLNAQTSQLRALQSSYDNQSTKLSDILSKSAQLETTLASTHEEYKAEINTQKRVVELLESRESESRKRVEQVNKEFDVLVAKSESETIQQNEELSRERHRSSQLEIELNELRVNGFGRVGESIGAPSTPQPNQMETSYTLSPTASIASRFHKGGKSFTEIYSDYAKLENEFQRERAERRRLESCLADVVSEIEERAPLLQEQRREYDKRNAEANALASQLAESLEERDALKASEKEARLVAENAQREAELQSQSIVDLTRQVAYLTRQIAAIEDPSLPTDAQNVAPAPAHELAVDQAISDRLVLFASTEELVQQNKNLLKVSRELGQKLEHVDAVHEARSKETENESLQEAYELIQQLKDEIELSREKAGSYVRERDMFRRLLAQTGKAVPEIGQEADESLNMSTSSNTPDYAALMAELQQNFDAYRTEMGTDTKSLKESLTASQREVSSLNVQLAQANAQVTFLNERHSMILENHNMSKMELSQLGANNQKLQTNLINEQINLNKVQEELIELKGVLERTKNENSKLRTEGEVHKGIENRLLADNESLSRDRVHLNDLMRNLQVMQAELERTSQESRARHDNQISSLEDVVKNLKEDLANETDQHKQLSLRRELESKDYQVRIDRLTSELHTSRENLVEIRTTRDHLQVRTDDLIQQLKNKEERLVIFENRTGNRNENLTSEQQLQIEIAELRSELEMAKSEVSKSETHVEQFKEIASANERALQDMNESYDNYKQTQDKLLSEREQQIKQYESRIEGMTEQVEQLQSENNEIHQKLINERSEFSHEKKALEDILADLNNAQGEQEARFAELRNDRNKQSDYAHENHDKYQREVLLHAQSVEQLQQMKKETDNHQQAIKGANEERDTAVQALKQAELSWQSQKELMDIELNELRKRHGEIIGQNDVLHKHLETVNKKIAEAGINSINQNNNNEAVAQSSETANSSDLQSVINYLRNEREYLDLQLSLSKQENSRFKTQLERLNESIDETRALLTEERNKNARGDVSAVQHQELLSKIDQLNLLRESNTTLRFESQRNRNKVLELESALQSSQNVIQPLEENIRNLTAELQVSKKEVEHWKEDADRWQKRNQQILSKYERIDPAELQKYKDDAEQLRKSLEEVKKELEETNKKLQEAQNEVNNQKTRNSDLISRSNNSMSRSKEAARIKDERLKDLEEQLSKSTEKSTQFDKISEELTKTRQEYQTMENAKKEIEKKLEEAEKQSGDVTMQETPNVSNEEKLKLEKELNETRTKAGENEKLIEDLKKQLSDKDTVISNTKDQAASGEGQQEQRAAGDTVTATNASVVTVQQLEEKLRTTEKELAETKEKVSTLETELEKKTAEVIKVNKSLQLKQRMADGYKQQVTKAETIIADFKNATSKQQKAATDNGPTAPPPTPAVGTSNEKQSESQPSEPTTVESSKTTTQPKAQPETQTPAPAPAPTAVSQPATSAPAVGGETPKTPETPQVSQTNEDAQDTAGQQDKGKEKATPEEEQPSQVSIAGAAGGAKKGPIKKLEKRTPGDAQSGQRKQKISFLGLAGKVLPTQQTKESTTPQKRQRDEEASQTSIKGTAKKTKENDKE